MRRKILVNIRSSVSAKFLVSVFSIYVAAAVAVTVFHVAAEYNSTREDIIRELNIIGETFKKGIAGSFRSKDENRLDIEIKGIMKNPIVVGVKVVSNDIGKILTVGKSSKSENCQNLIERTFQIVYNERRETCNISIYSDRSAVIQRIRPELVLFSFLVKTAALLIIFLVVGERLLNRPLSLLAESAEKLDFDNLETARVDIGTKDRNEFMILEETFNAMIEKLLNSREMHKELYRELLEHRIELEKTVEERTKALQKSNQMLEKEIEDRKLADEALRVSEKRLTEAQRIARMGNWDWNIRSNELFWSDEIYRIFGLRLDEFVPTYNEFINAVHPDDREYVQRSFDEALYEGRPYLVNHRIVRPNGTTRFVREQGEVTFEANYEPVRMVGTIQDITGQKNVEDALRSSRAELQALFAGMTDIVLMLDENGRYLKVAPTSPDLLYKPPDKAIGKTLYEMFPKKTADMFLRKVRRSLRSKKTVSVEYSMKIKDKDVWFEGRISPMSIGAVVVVARDITDRKEIEEDLRRAKDAAEDANKTKNAFLAGVSHEFRTPLNAILGFAQIMASNRELQPEFREKVNSIIFSGQRLLILVNQILEIARSGKNDFDLPSELEKRDLENGNAVSEPAENSKAGFHPLTPGSLSELPEDIVSDLMSAIGTIDYDNSIKVIERIRAHNEQLAESLKRLVDEYRFDTLQKLFIKKSQ